MARFYGLLLIALAAVLGALVLSVFSWMPWGSLWGYIKLSLAPAFIIFGTVGFFAALYHGIRMIITGKL